MKTILIIIFFASGIITPGIVPFINAYVVKWGKEQNPDFREKYSTVWHFLIGVFKASWITWCIMLGYFNSFSFEIIGFYTLCWFILFWPIYDLVYNIFNGHSWYYSGSVKSHTGSFWDKILRRWDEVLKGGLLLLTALWFPLNIAHELVMLAIRIRDNWIDWTIAVMLIVTFYFIVRKVRNK